MTVSYLMKAETQAIDRLERCRRNSVWIPQPVLAEISFGLERLPQSTRRKRLYDRLGLLLSEIPRAEWTDQVSFHFAAVKTQLEAGGQPLEDFDIAIAAHALAQDAILVSSNLAHMGRIPGLEVEDWGRS